MTKTNIFLCLFLIVYTSFLFFVYMNKIYAFGCFDDCSNFMTAYFMLKDKALYSEIFYNHQMLSTYISYIVQRITNPETIHLLVLYHRITLFLFAFCFNLLIVWRFRFVGIGFVFLYEITKFYLFGDRFLAESFIVYPLVYILGLLWILHSKKKIYRWEYILCGALTWFIIFMREPYIAIAVFLYCLFLLSSKDHKFKIVSLLILFVLCFATLATVPISDYFFNIVTVNQKTVLSSEIEYASNTSKLFAITLYPIYQFFSGTWNNFRIYTIGLSSVFLFLSGYFMIRKKRTKEVIYIFLILALANLRPIQPGEVFYEAFHILVWYGLFIFILCIYLYELILYKKRNFLYGAVILIGIVFYNLILSSSSFIWEKTDKHKEYITQFGQYISNGEVIRILSDKGDTLFLDGFDDLIYWQAKVDSSYKYSWYTSVMHQMPLYTNERIKMFSENPPDFYYGNCPKENNILRMLPESQLSNYKRMLFSGLETCLFIRKNKLKEIKKFQFEDIKRFGYSI